MLGRRLGEYMRLLQGNITSIKDQLCNLFSQVDVGVDAYKAYMTMTLAKDYIAGQAQFRTAHMNLDDLVHSLVEERDAYCHTQG
jgi:hypothetical protein